MVFNMFKFFNLILFGSIFKSDSVSTDIQINEVQAVRYSFPVFSVPMCICRKRAAKSGIF